MSTIVTRSGKGSGLTNEEMDANLNNLNNDKYESGDNITSGDLTTTGDLTLKTNATVVASGSVQADATLLTSTFNIITTSSPGSGVRLPPSIAGLLYTVVNTTANSVKIYPASSGTINSGTANSSIVVPAGVSVKLVGQTTSNWNTMVDMVIYDSTGTRLN